MQIGQPSGGFFNNEPQNALTLALEPVGEGLRVTLGEQQWYREQGGQIMVGGLLGFSPSSLPGHLAAATMNQLTHNWPGKSGLRLSSTRTVLAGCNPTHHSSCHGDRRR